MSRALFFTVKETRWSFNTLESSLVLVLNHFSIFFHILPSNTFHNFLLSNVSSSYLILGSVSCSKIIFSLAFLFIILVFFLSCDLFCLCSYLLTSLINISRFIVQPLQLLHLCPISAAFPLGSSQDRGIIF